MGEGVRSSVCEVVVLVLFFSCGVRGSSETETRQRDELYAEALKLRSQIDAKSQHLEHAGRLLLEAAGIKAEQVKPPNVLFSNLTDHPGILRELAKALERGEGMPKNLVLSLQLFRRAAELGDPEAHGEMGVRSSFGLQSDSTASWFKPVSKFTKADIPGAILHYTYGAQGNDTVSEMALGFRHMFGFGVPKNCPTAVSYYNAVAEKVIALGQSPGNLPSIERVRLSLRALQGSRKSKEEHMLQYYQYSADLGDVEAQTAIGQVFTYGSHGIPQDHELALHYFSQAALAGDAGAMSHLGHMYANGLGVEQNNATAMQWFEKGAAKGHKNAHFGLGYMYLSGYGVTQNYQRAYNHFSKAADMDHTDAQFHLGVMYLKGLFVTASPMRAKVFFGAASHSGHLLAMYNLAMMYLSGSGAEPNCYSALKLLKQVAERGPWSRILQAGHESFSKRDYSHSALLYLRAAQMGLELGQNNAAWMLEHNFLPKLEPDSIKIALDLYKLSAAQDVQVSTMSLLAIGDIYFYGRGISKNWNQSANVYRHAERQKSARGAFNLGFMYEFGAGLPKDVQMAKRYYELSFEYNEDAFYAAKLATMFLAVHVWWDSLHGSIPSWVERFGDGFFALKYADQNSVPHGWWSGRRDDYMSDPQKGGIMGKIMGLLDFDLVGEFFQDVFAIYNEDDVAELLETLVLGVLIIIFLLMFWRRQNNNRQVADRNHIPAPMRAHVPPVPPATPVEGNNAQVTPQSESGTSTSVRNPNPTASLPPESSSRSSVEPRIATPPTPKAQAESLPSSQSSMAGGETSGTPQDG